MREIKYRVWHPERKIMYEFEDILVGENIGSLKDFFQRKDIVILQYTGLKDKNATEIYDGYRVQIGNMYWLCFWDEEKGRFGFRLHQNGKYIYCRVNEIKKKGEVWNNIYQTPNFEENI